MTIWYPRFSLDLTVPIAGSSREKKTQQDDDSVVRFSMPVNRIRWERNDYSMADVLEVEADWAQAGIDPRMIMDATGEFYLWNATDPRAPARPPPGSLRFCGIMQRPARHWSPERRTSTLLFHDYTSIFLCEKPFVTKGVPDYSMTLSQAWACICDHVGPTDPDSGEIVSVIGKNLRNTIQFSAGASDVVLGTAVAARFRKDKIPIGGVIDAWAVWQSCVQMCGLISYIEDDHLVITTATDFYSEDNPARFITGRNILDLEEDRDVRRTMGGIILESFNPMTGTTVEAFSPRLGDSSVRKKVLKVGKKPKTADQIVRAENREVFFYPGVTDVGRLEQLADRVQEERSRQELAGRITTAKMAVDAVNGASFDLLTLRAGDVISIEVEPEVMRAVLGVNGEEARIGKMVAMGYAPGAAAVLVRNLAGFARLGNKFFVKSVTTTADCSSSQFQNEIHYVNRILPTGDTAAP